MKRVGVAVALLIALLVPGVASAHPLGNFTVNHYARIEPRVDGLTIHYVLDQAEIPTFQDNAQISADPEAFADQRAAAIGSNLHVTFDGQPLPLRLDSRVLTLPDGAGGLPTLRLEATFSALYPTVVSQAAQLQLRDDNDPTRIGWREIIAEGPVLQSSSVPATDVSDALRSYPDDLLNSPLNVREATLRVGPVGSTSLPASTAVVANGNAVVSRVQSTFADLANGHELTPLFLVFAVGVALVLGAAHALQPGHGKTVVAAYLVGSRGTPRHALFLGVTVTATHTAGVYALGLVTLALSQYIVPERLYPFLEAGSGLVVLAIGIWLFGQRLLTAIGLRHEDAHNHHQSEEDHFVRDHSMEDRSVEDRLVRGHLHEDESVGEHFAGGHVDGGHSQGHQPVGRHSHGGHSHSHEVVGWRSLLALGISGGLLPCPEALMVLLITIAAHRVLFGLLLIVAFSTGLAAVLVGFGLLLVYARGLFQRLNFNSGLATRLLPVTSALIIVVAGGVITVQALPQVL